ncbi:hypothetical protein BDV39DRAFT_166030 [Aspergillus sergii]|uniref:Uncharacterized protein n=1 Tax=Aspergillus sergii TaxID=1034303 RepID=A0A5N6XK00_9EURO|nr:hypothetical protein BDV39DRAFT_166030 [Aspergillus sergii]
MRHRDGQEGHWDLVLAFVSFIWILVWFFFFIGFGLLRRISLVPSILKTLISLLTSDGVTSIVFSLVMFTSHRRTAIARVHGSRLIPLETS